MVFYTLFFTPVFLILIVSLLFIWGARYFYKRKASVLASLFTFKITIFFCFFVIVPAFIIGMGSVGFLQIGMNAWFGKKVRTAVHDSQTVARAYLAEHKKVLESSVQRMGEDLMRYLEGDLFQGLEGVGSLKAFPELGVLKKSLGEYLSLNTHLGDLDEAIVVDRQGEIIARSDFSYSLEFEKFSAPRSVPLANSGQIFSTLNEANDRIIAFVQISAQFDLFLLVSRKIDTTVLNRVKNAEKAVDSYNALLLEKEKFFYNFVLVLLGLIICLLFIAVWAGLYFSKGLIRPLGTLIESATNIQKGHFVPIPQEVFNISLQEIKEFLVVFEEMIQTLGRQKKDLEETNKKLVDSNGLLQSVLSSISSGVMSVSENGRVYLWNDKLWRFLKSDERETHVDVIGKVISGFQGFFYSLLQKQCVDFDVLPLTQQIDFSYKNKELTYLFQGRLLQSADRREFVVTFEDVSDLLAAQKRAAWSDVARRVAHEIKNPLTPIRLSAERLLRKYMPQLSTGQETFESCIAIIIRQVDLLGSLISEFSSFARMPLPLAAESPIKGSVTQSVLLYQQAYPQIHFSYSGSLEEIYRLCDQNQMDQIMNNVLKNATESVLEKLKKTKAQKKSYQPSVEVVVEEFGKVVVLRILDNGVGLPKNFVEYQTTKKMGEGLGLSIVKKIVKDHAGDFHIDNRLDPKTHSVQGVVVTIRLFQGS